MKKIVIFLILASIIFDNKCPGALAGRYTLHFVNPPENVSSLALVTNAATQFIKQTRNFNDALNSDLLRLSEAEIREQWTDFSASVTDNIVKGFNNFLAVIQPQLSEGSLPQKYEKSIVELLPSYIKLTEQIGNRITAVLGPNNDYTYALNGALEDLDELKEVVLEDLEEPTRETAERTST